MEKHEKTMTSLQIILNLCLPFYTSVNQKTTLIDHDIFLYHFE